MLNRERVKFKANMYCACFAVVLVVSTVLISKLDAKQINGRTTDHDFDHNVDFSHPYTGEIIKLKSQGRIKSVIHLNQVEGLKKIRCPTNKLQLVFEDSETAGSWTPGDVIFGDHKWDCQLGLAHAPEKGIFRKIQSLKFINKKRVDVITTEASLYEIFEHADIFFHHTPAKREHASESHDRERRGAIKEWWDSAVEKGKSKALDLIFPINIDETKGLIRDFNYDQRQDKAAGTFYVEMSTKNKIEFGATGNPWFLEEKGEKKDDGPITHSAAVVGKVECSNCYMYFSAAVTFQLNVVRTKDNKIEFKRFHVQFDAEAKLNYDINLSIKGKYSAKYEKELWRSGKDVAFRFPIPAIPGLFLKFTLTPALSFEAVFDANAKVSFDVGFDSLANFTVSRTKTNGVFETRTERFFQPFNIHTPKVDFTADVKGTVSVIPKIEIAGGLSIGDGIGEIFELSLMAPIELGVKPDFIVGYSLSSAIGLATIGTFTLQFTTEAFYALNLIKLDLKTLGKLNTWKLFELKKEGSISLMPKQQALNLRPPTVTLICPPTLNMKCDSASKPATSNTDKRLKKLTDKKLVFKSTAAQYMAINMASHLLKFVELIRNEKGWANRKIIVKSAWSATAKDLAAEGREIRIGVTKDGSDGEDSSNESIMKLHGFAQCARFCGTSFDRNGVVVGIKRNKIIFGSFYETRMYKAQSTQLKIYDLPVGQGDCTIIQCPSGEISIVDMGTSSTSKQGYWTKVWIQSFITSKNVKKVKHIFVTHSDDNRHNLIKKVILPSSDINVYFSADAASKLNSKLSGYKLKPVPACTFSGCPVFNICPGVAVEVVASKPSSQLGDDKSLVLRLKQSLAGGTFTMLFPGQTKALASVNNLKANPSLIEADVYKLSSQGNKDSLANTYDFMTMVKPKYVISSGDPWSLSKKPDCVPIKHALSLDSLADNNSTRYIRGQKQITCIEGSRKTLNSAGKPVYTHAPTVDTVNLLDITYDMAFKRIKVTPSAMISNKHDTLGSRRKRSCATDGAIGEATQSGSDLPNLLWCEGHFKSVDIGKSIPDGKTMDEVCKPIIYPITRTDERFENLFYYDIDDVLFKNEENKMLWCGMSSSKCPPCTEVDRNDDLTARCADRVMTFRLAFRLRRLAFLAMQKFDKTRLQVVDAWAEGTAHHPKGKYTAGSLHYEGRAAKLQLLNGTATELAALTTLAQCAGFDYVQFQKETKDINVCVLLQEDLLGELISFHKAQLFAIQLPSYLEDEYASPEELKNETRQTKLLDGVNTTLQISENFKVKDFAYPDKRFFRLDTKLVECLEQIKYEFPEFELIGGSVYRTSSVNARDIGTRHEEEMFRFQAGQAAEIKLKQGSKRTFMNLVRDVTRACLPVFNFEQMVLGLGAHKQKLYLEMRPQELGETLRMKVWDSERSPWFKNLSKFADAVNNGGALIDPINVERACSRDTLGEDYHFISEYSDTARTCSDEEPSFCKETQTHRAKAAKEFKIKVKKVVPLTAAAIKDIDNCFVDVCGCGIGFGGIWDKKIKACLHFMSYYVEKASVAFPKADKAGFFNTANVNSSVHSLACDNGLCVENTQMYSLLKPMLMTIYKPNPQETVEEMVYSSRDNPNPSLTLLEQFMAMKVKGQVNVYLETDQDISILRKVLKVLLVFNKEVSKVVFHLTKNAHTGKVQEAISRKTEFWASGTCPDHSRVAITPFDIVEVAPHKVRRSIELSEPRNKRMAHIHDWEMRWLSRN